MSANKSECNLYCKSIQNPFCENEYTHSFDILLQVSNELFWDNGNFREKFNRFKGYEPQVLREFELYIYYSDIFVCFLGRR